MSKALRLTAFDEEDLSVLAATLQDAILRVGDMTYLPRRRRFALVCTRFKWEEAPPDAAGTEARQKTAGRAVYQRVRCGVHFDHVMAVQSHDILLDRKKDLLSLLTVTFEPSAEEGSGEIRLLFAGGGAIRLRVECIDAALGDMGAPWATPNRPHHGVDDDRVS